MRNRPIPWAYRVFFRHIGLDPDEQPTPVEALDPRADAEGRVRQPEPARRRADDRDRSSRAWRCAPSTPTGRGRSLDPAEHAGGGSRGPARRSPAGTLVIADELRPLALLFGATAAGRGRHAGDGSHDPRRGRRRGRSGDRRRGGAVAGRRRCSRLNSPIVSNRRGRLARRLQCGSPRCVKGARVPALLEHGSEGRERSDRGRLRPSREGGLVEDRRSAARRAAPPDRPHGARAGRALRHDLPAARASNGRSAAAGGPRVLGIAELEGIRDTLADRLAEARAEIARRADEEQASRELVERMIADPAELPLGPGSQRGRRRARLQALALAPALGNHRHVPRLVAGKALLGLSLSHRAALTRAARPEIAGPMASRSPRASGASGVRLRVRRQRVDGEAPAGRARRRRRSAPGAAAEAGATAGALGQLPAGRALRAGRDRDAGARLLRRRGHARSRS